MSEDNFLENLFTWKEPSSIPTCSSGLTKPTISTNIYMPSPHKAHEAPLSIPEDTAVKLFDYQRDGIQWLYRKHCHARACLLADEMGLGKTVQVCAFLGILYKQKKIKTTIIVLPPTLLLMWEHALQEWGLIEKGLIELVHSDAKARRTSRWKKLSYGLPCVILTTYGVLRNDAANMSATMVDYVVLDEAHLIKDAKTQVFKSALMLSARHKIALTGTPLMNSFEDMWSIFSFLDGAILDVSRSEFKFINATMLRGNERDASAQQRLQANSELEKMQVAIKPFMLRRDKKDVCVLQCTKHDSVVWIRLNDLQRKQYTLFLQSKDVMDAHHATNEQQQAQEDLSDVAIRPDEWVEMEEGNLVAGSPSGNITLNPLLLLTTLLQLCNHPWLSLTNAAFREALKKPFCAPCEEVGDLFAGPKLSVALALLTRSINEGRKCCVFCRSKRMLSMLAALLTTWNITFTRIDGDISTEERFNTIHNFNEDARVWVCLLTTQVGGIGITFHAASCVILLDPSWNPSVDAQAIDRVHRIGQQRKDVMVFRLITCGTIEEKVYRNQVFKAMAAKQSTHQVDGQTIDLFCYFTRMQLRSMFEVGDLDESLTATQLEQLHPDKVQPAVWHIVKDIPGLCAVSDNGCILTEGVVAEAVTENTPTRSQPLKYTKRVRSFSHSLSPSPHSHLKPKKLDLSQESPVVLSSTVGPQIHSTGKLSFSDLTQDGVSGGGSRQNTLNGVLEASVDYDAHHDSPTLFFVKDGSNDI